VNYPPRGTRLYGALILANRIQFQETPVIPLNAEFNNCIIYGSFQQEIKMDNIEENGDVTNDFKYKFNSCLIRYELNKYSTKPEFDKESDAFQNVIWNESPDFILVEEDSYDFHIDISSAAVRKGDSEIITTYPECATDKDGVERSPDKKPDIGAYEYVY